MRILLRVALGILGTVCLLVLAVRAQQYTFRLKAEKLERDISVFQYGRTTFAEARPILWSWNATVGPDPSCAERTCSAGISFGDLAYRHSTFFSNHQRLFRAYGILGGRPAIVGAGMSFRDSVMHSKSYSVAIEVFPHESPAFGFTQIGYSLLGETSVMESFPWRPSKAFVKSQHPTYQVGSPGGCEVCISIWAHFTGGASETDLARVGVINLSCLTRWFQPCRVKGDVMPAAWEIERSEDPYSRPD